MWVGGTGGCGIGGGATTTREAAPDGAPGDGDRAAPPHVTFRALGAPHAAAPAMPRARARARNALPRPFSWGGGGLRTRGGAEGRRKKSPLFRRPSFFLSFTPRRHAARPKRLFPLYHSKPPARHARIRHRSHSHLPRHHHASHRPYAKPKARRARYSRRRSPPPPSSREKHTPCSSRVRSRTARAAPRRLPERAPESRQSRPDRARHLGPRPARREKTPPPAFGGEGLLCAHV